MLYCLTERSMSIYRAKALSTDILSFFDTDTLSAALVRASADVHETSSSIRLLFVRCDAFS